LLRQDPPKKPDFPKFLSGIFGTLAEKIHHAEVAVGQPDVDEKLGGS
jgi:hypothetical protein